MTITHVNYWVHDLGAVSESYCGQLVITAENEGEAAILAALNKLINKPDARQRIESLLLHSAAVEPTAIVPAAAITREYVGAVVVQNEGETD